MSYTEELTAKVVAAYTANPSRETVEKIAKDINKSPRSVIAKLAAAGVYQTPQRTTKTGDPIVKKEELVAEIEEWVQIPCPTLVKTGKEDLKRLHAALKEVFVE